MMFVLLSSLIGFAASTFSSVFGGGFGLIAVPSIYWLIIHSDLHSVHAMQITIATGTLCSIPLGIIASYKQLCYRNVDLKLFKTIVMMITFGAIIGAYSATVIASTYLKYIFAMIVFLAALGLIYFHRHPKARLKLSRFIFQLCAGLIGAFSVFAGVSVFIAPFLIMNGIETKKAIGTSTLLVFTYTLFGGTWLIFLGIPKMGISAHYFGYANLDIFLPAVIPCLIGGLVGAKLTHVLPAALLKKLFIAMMFVVSVIMIL